MDDELMEALDSENTENAGDGTAKPEGQGDKPEPDYKAKAKAFYAQNKELRAKVKEYEEKEAANTKKQEDSVPDIPVKEVLSLRAEGYSESEILRLHGYASSMRKPISEVAKDPFIAGGILAERQKAKDAAAVPTPSNRVPVVNGKTIEQLDDAEFKGNYDKLVADALAKKRAK